MDHFRIRFSIAVLAACAGITSGCATPSPRNSASIDAYYDYEFAIARENLRAAAYLRNDEQVLLNNLRLGMASMADGDPAETERAFHRVFDLLSTAGLNADRTTAAILLHEGVRIWKGEPFEQALAYHAIAAHYATLGDWENARAAAANALFRLTDFGADRDEALPPEELARREAERPGYLDTGYTAVDTDFALGFLMEAIGSDLSGAAGAREQFDAAVAINPDLDGIVDTLSRRDYDTLLIIDYGRGPEKVAYGRDDALVRFSPWQDIPGPLIVTADGAEWMRAGPVCDVNAMARDHRWKNLEDVRRAKSMLGDALLLSGAIVADSGNYHHSDRTRLVGWGLFLGGLLTKAGARADTRYLEFAPAGVFLVPLRLDRPRDLAVHVQGDPGSRYVIPAFRPGSIGNPRAVYLRLHGPDSPSPAWLTSRQRVFSNDHTGVASGDSPWILGGWDLSTPSRKTFASYRAGGLFETGVAADLRDLYSAEDILIGSGMENRPGRPRNPSFRHIVEGGAGIFTPQPDSMGYKRLMYRHPPAYRPRSAAAMRRAQSAAESSTQE